MKPGNKNSYKSLSELEVNGNNYKYYSLKKAELNGLEGISKLPKSLKVLLENLLRYEDDISVNKKQREAVKNWVDTKKSKTEIAYRPARVLLQDYTGIPAVADLAAMREAVKEKNKDPNTINPLSAHVSRNSNKEVEDNQLIRTTVIQPFIDSCCFPYRVEAVSYTHLTLPTT